MKILYIVDSFPKLSESFIINEIKELRKRGYNISILAIHRPDEVISHDEVKEMDISVHYGKLTSLQVVPSLLSRRIINPTLLRCALYIDNPRYHIRCLHHAKQIIETVQTEGDVDLIHAHFASPKRLAVTYASAYCDIPCTLTAHATEIFASPNESQLRRVFSRFNHIVVPSEYNKRYLQKEFNVSTDISVVPATTSIDKFEPSDEFVSGRLLSVARLVEKKGHRYAIDSVAELVSRGYDVDYHIIGTGELESSLRQQVQDRGIEDRVVFHGHVSDDRLEQEIQEAEVFVLPCVIASDGDRDVAPVALKEAMATETACVSTSISAIPEMITDGHNGRLVEPNNVNALTDAIATLLDTPEERRRLATNARQSIENKFDIDIAVDKLEGVFQSTYKGY